MKIAVYTAITAGKDKPKDLQIQEGIDRIFYTDQPKTLFCSWDMRPISNLFLDPRRNSRAPKILAHQYLPKYDYSLWIDGSIHLLASVTHLIDEHLDEADIAMFRHPARSCLYIEAADCADAGLDQRHVLEEQTAKYRSEGYPANNGLNECAVILRRHTPTIATFNEAWWAEYCRHSCRDQVSLPYVLHKLGVRCAPLPGTIQDNSGIVINEKHAW